MAAGITDGGMIDRHGIGEYRKAWGSQVSRVSGIVNFELNYALVSGDINKTRIKCPTLYGTLQTCPQSQ